MTNRQRLFSAGDIAAALRMPVKRVCYVLDHRPIRPVQRAGITRLYRADVVERVREELEAIATRTGRPIESNHPAPLPLGAA